MHDGQCVTDTSNQRTNWISLTNFAAIFSRVNELILWTISGRSTHFAFILNLVWNVIVGNYERALRYLNRFKCDPLMMVIVSNCICPLITNHNHLDTSWLDIDPLMSPRWLSPSHYLNQTRRIVNWTFIINTFQWNLNHNTTISIQENAFENVACKISASMC